MKKWNSKTWENRKSKNADTILIDRLASPDACKFLSVDGHGDMADDMDIHKCHEHGLLFYLSSFLV